MYSQLRVFARRQLRPHQGGILRKGRKRRPQAKEVSESTPNEGDGKERNLRRPTLAAKLLLSVFGWRDSEALSKVTIKVALTVKADLCYDLLDAQESRC